MKAGRVGDLLPPVSGHFPRLCRRSVVISDSPGAGPQHLAGGYAAIGSLRLISTPPWTPIWLTIQALWP